MSVSDSGAPLYLLTATSQSRDALRGDSAVQERPGICEEIAIQVPGGRQGTIVRTQGLTGYKFRVKVQRQDPLGVVVMMQSLMS